ncbi:MAG TPA: hypothetical protein VK689_08550 [Armatimonadota bacterium]|jgi:hypothetical protein|nr:hypothetical protein [Armatimonadota bacterium]
MPASYRIDHERRVVLFLLEGTVTDDELGHNLSQVMADPHFHPEMRQLVDARRITSVEATSAGIREMARSLPFTRESRMALVVSTDAAFGVARMFQNLVDHSGEQMLVVRDICEATRWLGLE